MKNGVHDNVTVMSADELNIRDEDIKKMETQEVTLDVKVYISSKTNDPSRGIISFILSDVPANEPEDKLKGYAINALQEAMVKEEFIKFKDSTGVSLFAADDISKVTIEEVAVRKGE